MASNPDKFGDESADDTPRLPSAAAVQIELESVVVVAATSSAATDDSEAATTPSSTQMTSTMMPSSTTSLAAAPLSSASSPLGDSKKAGPPPPPWATMPFLAPKLAGQRKIFYHLSPVVWAALSVLFWTLLAIYFGQGYKPNTELGNLTVLVVDLDSGSIATALQAAVAAYSQQPGPHQTLQWTNTLSYDDAIAQINGGNESVYGAIVLNSGSSAALESALAVANTSVPPYNASTVLTLVYDEGRNPVAEALFILAFQEAFVRTFAAAFGSKQAAAFTASVLNASSPGAANASLAAAEYNPQALGSPIGFTVLNLHPVGTNYVAILATTIANIYLFVLCIIGSVAVVGATGTLAPKVHKHELLAVRLAWIFLYCVAISLVMAINVAIFRGEFVHGWVPYWLLVLLTACALAYTQLFLFLALPIFLYAPVTLILLVMNISTGEFLLFLQLSDPFYLYGYAFVFHNSIQAARYILFGSFDRLYQNLPILFAWVVSSLSLCVIKVVYFTPSAAAANLTAAGNFTRGVARIHNVLKRAIDSILSADPAALPPAKLATFAQYANAFTVFIHGHHHSEDEIVFPSAHGHDSDHVGPIIDKLSLQHQTVSEVLAKLTVLCASPATFTVADAEQVQAIFRDFRPWLTAHLDTEVREMDIHFYHRFYTTEDIVSVHTRTSQHGQTAGDPNLIFPFFVYGMNPEERADFKHSVFPPVRILLFPTWTKTYAQVWRDWAPFVTERNGQLVW